MAPHSQSHRPNHPTDGHPEPVADVSATTPDDVRAAAGHSPRAQQAARKLLAAWAQIQRRAARAKADVHAKIVAATPYVLAKLRALVARVAELTAQGIRWTLDQLLRLDEATRGHLGEIAFWATLALLTLASAKDPLLLVRLGEAALTGLLESVSGFLKVILSGLALLLVAETACAAARWAWNLGRSTLACVLMSLRAPASLLADALRPSAPPAADP